MTYLGVMRDRLTTPISIQPPSQLYDTTRIGKTITEMTKAQTSASHSNYWARSQVLKYTHTCNRSTCRNNGLVVAATVTPLFTRHRSTVRINSENFNVVFHGHALFTIIIIVNILQGLYIIPLPAFPQNDGTRIFMYATLLHNFFFVAFL